MYLDPGRAEARALELEFQGADILDIGAESSRPGAKEVDAKEELRRLLPVIKRLAGKLKIPMSVDTFKYEVMQAVLDEGVQIINDITAGSQDPRVAKLIGSYAAKIVLMHMRGMPQTMQKDVYYQDLVGEVTRFLIEAKRRFLEAGVASDHVIVDPGIGFGKSAEGNFELLHSIREIKATIGSPILIGLSKKSFLKALAGNEAANLAAPMAAAHALALAEGADFLRVHDIIDAKHVLNFYIQWNSL